MTMSFNWYLAGRYRLPDGLATFHKRRNPLQFIRDLPHAILEVASLHCLAGRGIEGDRFLDFKPDYKGQITFFAWEEFERLCRTLEVRGKTPAAFRRNVITEGVDLLSLVGQEFEIQGVRFRGHSECSPCYWMDQAFAPGAEAALRGRGGLRAQILTDGMLATSEVGLIGNCASGEMAAVG